MNLLTILIWIVLIPWLKLYFVLKVVWYLFHMISDS